MAHRNLRTHAMLKEYNKQSILAFLPVPKTNVKNALANLTQLHIRATATQNTLAQMDTKTKKIQTTDASKNLKHNLLVEKVATEVYNNLLFTQSQNELVQEIKRELFEQEEEIYLFKYHFMTKEIQVYYDSMSSTNELFGEEKEYILQELWNITLKKVADTMQSVSSQGETIMDVKSTSGTSASYSAFASTKSSNIYATSQVARVSNTQPAQAVQATSGDTVTVSPTAMLRTEALHTALSTSEVRQEKIQAIKDKLTSGKYTIDTKKLAFNLIREEVGLFS